LSADFPRPDPGKTPTLADTHLPTLGCAKEKNSLGLSAETLVGLR
jgi:hypothetical protein